MLGRRLSPRTGSSRGLDALGRHGGQPVTRSASHIPLRGIVWRVSTGRRTVTNDDHRDGPAGHAVHAEQVGHTHHVEHTEHPAHEGQGHGAYGGHGDHAAQFRDRFWWSLLLAPPVVGFSAMFADLLGYAPPPATG